MPKRRKKPSRKRVVRAVRRVVKKVRKTVRRVKRSAAPKGFRAVAAFDGASVEIKAGSFDAIARKAMNFHRKTGVPATVYHGNAKLGKSTKRGFMP